MTLILFICIGFVLAVVWIDLKFDWLAVPYRGKPGVLPEEVLAPMSYFFRYITVNPIVFSIVMIFITLSLILEIVQASVPAWVAWTSLGLFGLAMVRAFLLVMPAARRLGLRSDSLEEQTRIAHHLWTSHLLGFICTLLMGMLQLYAFWR